jgi:hypothetical protein
MLISESLPPALRTNSPCGAKAKALNGDGTSSLDDFNSWADPGIWPGPRFQTYASPPRAPPRSFLPSALNSTVTMSVSPETLFLDGQRVKTRQTAIPTAPPTITPLERAEFSCRFDISLETKLSSPEFSWGSQNGKILSRLFKQAAYDADLHGRYCLWKAKIGTYKRNPDPNRKLLCRSDCTL